MPVEKRKGGYGVRNVPTTHKTKKAAQRQHRAIQADKARRKGKR
jgi:hypothetical protein